MDIDLLLYGAQIIAEPNLQVPHPRMHLRRWATCCRSCLLRPRYESWPGTGLACRSVRVVPHDRRVRAAVRRGGRTDRGR
jgi:hypothetical protein